MKLAPSSTDPVVPWVLLDLPTADGATMHLCDYASAGANGTRYRSWLKTTAASADRKDPAPVAADGAFVKAALRGDARPEHGRLRKVVGATPAPGRNGRPATALRLDGQSGLLVYALPLEVSGDFTIAVRVRINAPVKNRLARFSARGLRRWTIRCD